MKELNVNIAGAYLGCEATYIGNDGNSRTMEVDAHFIASMPVMGNPQLILTPVERISNEDLVEVAKIFYSDGIGGIDISVKGGKTIVDGLFHIQYIKPIISALQFANIIDYLRSKHYDVGYGPIKSLITAGIAREKEGV